MNYKLRYKIEPGNWQKPDHAKKVAPRISATDDNYGYADDLFIVSILHNEAGEMESALPLSAKDAGPPSRETLLAIRKVIDHYLEKHCS